MKYHSFLTFGLAYSVKNCEYCSVNSPMPRWTIGFPGTFSRSNAWFSSSCSATSSSSSSPLSSSSSLSSLSGVVSREVDSDELSTEKGNQGFVYADPLCCASYGQSSQSDLEKVFTVRWMVEFPKRSRLSFQLMLTAELTYVRCWRPLTDSTANGQR